MQVIQELKKTLREEQEQRLAGMNRHQRRELERKARKNRRSGRVRSKAEPAV